MERCVRFEEAWSAWRNAGPGCMVWVASHAAVPATEAALCQHGVAVKRLGCELLARLEEPEALVGQESRGLGEGRPTGAVRSALQAALESLVVEWRAESSPLALRDFELAVAERLDLAVLAGLPRPLLLLAPGRRHGKTVRLFETPGRPGMPLPPALSEPDRVVILAEAPCAQREAP